MLKRGSSYSFINHSLKKNIILLLTVLLVFSCPGKKKSKEITLTYMNAESSTEQLKIMNIIASRFERLNPGIKITLVTGVKIEKILSTIASGRGVDVFMGWDQINEYYDRDAITVLNPYVEKHGFNREEYYPISLDLLTYKGNLLALPLQLKTQCLAYNKTLLQSAGFALPPKSWHYDDFFAYISKIYQTEQIKPNRMNRNLTITQVDFFIQQFFPEIFNTEKGNLHPDAFKHLVKMFDKQYKIIKKLPAPEEVAEFSAAGSASGMFSVFKMSKSYLQNAPAWGLIELGTIKNFDWDVVEYPHWGNGYMLIDDAYLAVTSISKHKDEAYKFIKFYISQTGADLFAHSKNGFSPRIASTKKYFTAPPVNISTYTDIMNKYKLLRTAVQIKNYSLFRQNLGHSGIYVSFRKGEVPSSAYAKKYIEYADKFFLPWEK
ncbi:MAG: hypothetical protein A2096_01830 [Spirochaetes bacterium GWF1_41_5]|nr:MAG: hypothetical protein A2096_01830 [Spirochaetes bacterium GWF1_41_5]HBE01911.1 hypothetical protein [Spirochaetia bacterium]